MEVAAGPDYGPIRGVPPPATAECFEIGARREVPSPALPGGRGPQILNYPCKTSQGLEMLHEAL